MHQCGPIRSSGRAAARIKAEHGEREREPGDRQAGGEGKIEAREAELIDEIGDHVDLAAADQLRGGEGAEGPGERGGHAGDDAGRRQRQRHGEEGADRPGAEARGGPLVVAVDVGQRRRQHDHHDRQGDVHERDDDAERREHELHRLLDQPGLEQHRVDEAVVAEHDDPGIGAHHLAEEQRRDRDDQDRRLERDVARMHQRIGQRIADEEREERREKADPDRVEEHPRIERLQQRGEIGEREAAGSSEPGT